MERIIAGSPRLADLTLEACRGVASLHVPRGARLRRLALRWCHALAAVALDVSELVAFEYRGAVPTSAFLTMHGGGGVPNLAYCKVDICGAEVSSEEEDIEGRRARALPHPIGPPPPRAEGTPP